MRAPISATVDTPGPLSTFGGGSHGPPLQCFGGNVSERMSQAHVCHACGESEPVSQPVKKDCWFRERFAQSLLWMDHRLPGQHGNPHRECVICDRKDGCLRPYRMGDQRHRGRGVSRLNRDISEQVFAARQGQGQHRASWMASGKCRFLESRIWRNRPKNSHHERNLLSEHECPTLQSTVCTR